MASLPDETEFFEEPVEPDTMIEEEAEAPEPTLLDLIGAPNIAEMLPEQEVAKIGYDALREYKIDLESCKDFHARYDRAMKAATQKADPKTWPWPNASNVIFPLLTQAAIQFQARSYPAIVDSGAVVKARVLGQDPAGEKAARAERVAGHMSWQFLNDVPGWEDDTDKLLLQLPIVGCVMRKTWHDSLTGKNCSETVSAKDFVVNYHTVSLDKAPRFTHVQRYYPHEIEAHIRSGEWQKVPYDGEDGSDPHAIVEMYEQHRLIDLDGDGLPEPYVVTITKNGDVARIAACFDAENIFVSSMAWDGQKPFPEAMELLREAGGMGADEEHMDVRVVRIVRNDYFTKYGFIPAPDGAFYDLGFGTLTDHLGAAVNTIINQLIDAGTLANMQGGFISGGTKIRGGNMRFSPGEWKRIEGVSAGPLRDSIMPLQLPGPSPTLFQLLGMLVDSIREITSVSDIMSGNQDTQTAPTTALALIEQGQKVFTGIYKRIHRALGQEIKIMFRLNRDFLPEKQYFALHDVPAEVAQADYQVADLDISPVSDPEAINDRAKMAKAQVVASHAGDPLVNQKEVRLREFQAAGITDIPKLLEVPPPEPGPEEQSIMAEIKREDEKAAADIRAKNVGTMKSMLEAAQLAYELGTTMGQEDLKALALRNLTEATMQLDSINGGNSEQPPMQPGGLPAMEGQPADAGLPAIPGGLPGQPGAEMGGGPAMPPAGPVPG